MARFIYRKRLKAGLNQLKKTPLRLWRGRVWAWRPLMRAGIIALAAGTVFALLLFGWYYKDLPKLGELRAQRPNEATILYDRNGKQVYDISGEERRILLASGDIPLVAKQATVAIEDRKFYSHHGVDFLAIVRGTILRPFTGRGIQGGSTITQQYIKNAILSPQRSIARKIKEIILAWEIEFVYSKDDILTLYLNEIPYGGNIYGIEAASQAYWGKSVKDGLTLAQIATLAAIPQSPTYFSPYGSHVSALLTRKNLVLDDMVKTGAISQAQADAAKKEAPLGAADFAQPRDNFPAPHFVMYVREQLVDKYGETAVQRGGLRVTTTLDLDVQKEAEAAMRDQAKTLSAVKATNAGLVAIEAKTDQILAMVGSVDYFDREHEGNFNVATAERQPGSAGKPIVYANLLSSTNYAPGSPLWDVQTDFGGGYKPNNFDGKFHGPVSIRKALGNSFNIPAIKALGLTGLPSFLDLARAMGITTFDKRKDTFGLSLAIGGGEVKLVDLVSAYAVLAAGGERSPLTAILKISDSRGKVIDEWKPSQKTVLKPEVAYEINSILSDPEAKRPTFGALLGVLSVGGKTTAVKTGTTDSFRDAWTIGYTPSLVAGVWAGNNDNAEMNHGGGSTAAAPIWHDFMVRVLKDRPNESFYRPESISDHEIDFLSGKNPTEASGSRLTDIFSPWQVPTADDDVHRLVAVCKSNGKLATATTPPAEVEQRIYSQVHSEKPQNPNWEGSVQAWASSSGLTKAPPTENCDIVTTDPKIKITNLSPGQEISGVFSLATEVTLPPGQTGFVDFTLDGTFLSRDGDEPYTETIDATRLSDGRHDLAAIVHASGGGSDTAQVSINVRRDVTPPGDVSNVSLVPGPTKGSAVTNWHNPADADLKLVAIYVSQASGVRGAKLASVEANPDTTQTATLSGLASATVNYVTFITVDATGNESKTATPYAVTPL